MKSLPGRGPGSGVHGTADSVATLLLGVFAGLALSETGPTARALAGAKIAVEKTCPLTGARNFRDALARLLSDQVLSDRTDEISVAFMSGTAQAIIDYDGPPLGPPETFDPGEAGEHSFFACRLPKGSALRIETGVDRNIIREVAAIVRGLS